MKKQPNTKQSKGQSTLKCTFGKCTSKSTVKRASHYTIFSVRVMEQLNGTILTEPTISQYIVTHCVTRIVLPVPDFLYLTHSDYNIMIKIDYRQNLQK